MKSIVLLTYVALAGGGQSMDKAQYFDTVADCQNRIAEIRATEPNAAKMRMSCHAPVGVRRAEGNDAI